jgi:hypothetical protein
MAATRGRGSKIRVKTTSGSYVDIAGLGDIELTYPENQFLDVTDQDTPTGSTKQLPVEASPGSVSAPINFDIQEQSHLLLMNARKANTLLDFQVRFAGPGSKRTAFQGYIISLPIQLPVSGVQRATLGIRVEGDFGDPEADV